MEFPFRLILNSIYLYKEHLALNINANIYISIEYIFFDFVRFYGILTHCWLFNAKSSLYIYIRYILFVLVGLYVISTIVCDLMPNPLYTYILNIYDLVWLGFMVYSTHCWLFDAKSGSHIYIKYLWFGLVGFYGIPNIVFFFILNPLYTYILNIYDLVWLGFMTYPPL